VPVADNTDSDPDVRRICTECLVRDSPPYEPIVVHNSPDHCADCFMAMSRYPGFGSDYGGLMSFNSNFPAAWRQGAVYVDKILRGANPADLPVQEPTQFDFVVNVKAAQALGITFPPDAAAQVTQWVQ
jgi:hypothetical protein